MNSAEHKAEAERLLDKVARGETMNSDRTLATAQVHATLANVPDVPQPTPDPWTGPK